LKTLPTPTAASGRISPLGEREDEQGPSSGSRSLTWTCSSRFEPFLNIVARVV
jgi:hypothetical protein